MYLLYSSSLKIPNFLLNRRYQSDTPFPDWNGDFAVFIFEQGCPGAKMPELRAGTWKMLIVATVAGQQDSVGAVDHVSCNIFSCFHHLPGGLALLCGWELLLWRVRTRLTGKRRCAARAAAQTLEQYRIGGIILIVFACKSDRKTHHIWQHYFYFFLLPTWFLFLCKI